MKVIHPLATTKYTYIECEDNPIFNAPHHFKVYATDVKNVGLGQFEASTRMLAEIDFQEGPIQEHGVNGVANEDLIVMVLIRLQGFQQSKFACRENALAITKLEEALMWLRARTQAREARGVEGRDIV